MRQFTHDVGQVVCVLNDLGLPRDPALRTMEVVKRLKSQGVAWPVSNTSNVAMGFSRPQKWVVVWSTANVFVFVLLRFSFGGWLSLMNIAVALWGKFSQLFPAS